MPPAYRGLENSRLRGTKACFASRLICLAVRRLGGPLPPWYQCYPDRPGGLAALDCRDTRACVDAERHFLNALDGSCRTPIAAHAHLEDDHLVLRGRLLSDAGDDGCAGEISGPVSEARALGIALAKQLRDEKPHLVAQT